MNGDARGFEAFAGREYPRLRRLAISLTGNSIDGEDILQETLIKLFVHWRKVERSTRPAAYARSIMVNTFLSAKRRRSATEVVVDANDAEHATEDPTEAFLTHHMLLARLDRLPQRQRAIVVLRFLEDLPVDEVASVMRMREGAVRTACHRALNDLRADAGHDARSTGNARTSYAT